MSPDFLNKLKEQLNKPLPGAQAQSLLAPFNRAVVNTRDLDASAYRLSAVMILFCHDESGELFLPLIQRGAYQGVHSAQISLPGGKFEIEDGDLSNTAKRECFEEIGIGDNIEVIGKLSQLFIPVSGFLVEPYIAHHSFVNPVFNAQTREVEEIYKLYVSSLIDDSNVKNGSVRVNDTLSIKAPYLLIENKQVWGATAMILSELRELIRTIS